MRLSAFILTTLLAFSGQAQTFSDRSDLLNDQNGRKHFSWSVSIADLDGNGLPDIHEPGILYLQQEDGTFVSSLPDLGITYRALPPPIQGYEGRGIFGSVMADMNDDGFNELIILDILEDSSKVFHNSFGLKLTEASPGNGIDFRGLGQGAAFADFNGDGTLDLFFGEEQGHNQLFLGDGAGGFLEATATAGIGSSVQTYGVATADYDNDGDMDVFIAACANDPARSVNLLFRNKGDGTFEEVGAAAGINDDGNAWGVNFLDYDRDGWLDIHLANMRINFQDGRGNANKLYRNLGDGTFEDVSIPAGVEGNDDSYGSSVADFNNDGWPDIWAANLFSPPTIWINNGDGTFTDVFPSAGLSDIFANLSVGVADINADGWVDVYSGADDGPLSRLLYNTPSTNHWLSVRLIQPAPNLSAIGARIEVWTDGIKQIRDISAGDGFVSQNMDLSAHFGLGVSALVDSVVVRWPGGAQDTWINVDADQFVTLQKGGQFNDPPTPFRALDIVTKKAGNQVDGMVAWEASSDPEGAAISYTVAVRDAGGTIVHQSDPVLGTEYSFEVDTTGVDLSGPWKFVVAATDGLHVRRSLNVGSVLLEGTQTASIEVPEHLALGALWPHPTFGAFTVEVSSSRVVSGRWRLVDMQGRSVRMGTATLNLGAQSLNVDASGLGAGMYLLRLESRSGVVSKPVLIVGN